MTEAPSLQRVLLEALGAGYPVSGGNVSHAWEVAGIEIGLADSLSERDLRRAWSARQGGGGTPLLLVAPEPAAGECAVLGPASATDPVRTVPIAMLADALQRLEPMERLDAIRVLSSELERLDTAGIPGVVVRGLLTVHVLEHRLRRRADWTTLVERAAKVRRDGNWRDNLAALGWSGAERTASGYLYRLAGAPALVVHPMRDAADFGRLTGAGSLPEGALIAECRSRGARWGMLSSSERFRLFRADEGTGSSTGRYVEFDLAVTQHDDWPYLGLLHADSLAPGGLLESLLEEHERFGASLRDRLEDRIRDEVMPLLARGLGRFESERGVDVRKTTAREEVEGGVLTLLFRLLFLFYCESQGFLPLASASYKPHALTTLARAARDTADGFDSKSTFFWDRFLVLVKAVRLGNRSLSVPAYNGDLFAPDGLLGAELLERASLTDEVFGAALAAIGFDPQGDDPVAGVDYAGLEVEHLGRIYESLLSLRLSVADVDLKTVCEKGKHGTVDRFVPAGPKDAVAVASGTLFYQSEEGGRKAGGVYYTRQDVVRHLVMHSVLPALREHLDRVAVVAEADSARASCVLFRFRVLDPAMGSAHFLADALDVIADEIDLFLHRCPLPGVSEHLQGLREHVQTDLVGSVEDGPLLRRLVLKHCIYGVDLSPMAVEVAKITLWLKSFVPGLALSYLNHNLRCGNSLVGVADESVLLETVGMAFMLDAYTQRRAQAQALADELAEVGDRTPEEVARSRELVARIAEVTTPLAQVFDLWTAEPLGANAARYTLQTEIDAIVEGAPTLEAGVRTAEAAEHADRFRFLHWPIDFPEVFGGNDPGFDVVVGNPPWEEVTLEELAFYALYAPGIRGLRSENERSAAIEGLKVRFPELPVRLKARQEELTRMRGFFGPDGGYRLQGGGDTDLYQLFCERYTHLAKAGGWIGVVLPRSAFLVEGTQPFRRWLFAGATVHRLDFLLNKGRWAFDMEPRWTFALLAAQRGAPAADAELATTAPSASESEFAAASRADGVRYPLAELSRWTAPISGPATFEVPLLPTQEAVAVFNRIRSGPRFDVGYKGVWHAFAVRELDETTDKALFLHDEGVPVWKGRSFDQFDAHGADPAGWAVREELETKLQRKRERSRTFKAAFPVEYLRKPSTLDLHHARVAFRDVSRATDSRTVRAALIPPETGLANSAPYLVFDVGGACEKAFVLGVLDSLPFDWQARRFVETHMNYFVLGLLALPPAESVDIDAIASRAARLSCIDERFEEFAIECGVEYGPIEDDEAATLRAEIDALVALGYGLAASDLDAVFSDFTLAAVPDAYREAVRDAFSRLGGEP